jgi:class 3 adenylate cyclase/TolB-like protein
MVYQGSESVQNMGRQRIQLTIQRQGEHNLVTLNAGGPMVYKSEFKIDEKLLRELVGQVVRLATPGEPLAERESPRGDLRRSETSVTTRRLQSIGEQIFSRLLPQEEARTQLRDAAPTDLFLHLDEQLIHVPWELCHDGVDFLATKFCIGRYVHSSRPIPSSNRETVAPGLLKVLLIADPTESLPQAAQEAEQLCHILDGIAKVKVTLLGGKLVSKAELLTEIQTHDVVHFAGHSHYDPVHPNHSGWHLHGGLLTAEELRNLSRPPLLVFSNSCQAGATTAWGGRYRYDEEAGGIGSAFLTAGVWNYIGTFWVVHDEESRDFAVAFYKGIASGLSLGEALREARQEIRGGSGSERLTWASYMLYGDPAVTFFPAGEVKFIPSPIEAVERKLVAILSADVKGYSRLIGEDDVATVRTLVAHRKVMTIFIQKHKGNVVDSPGDNLLALFPSVVGAVQCAVEIQQELKEKNAELPNHRKMEFRIGVNLGDIIIGKEGIHGNGVNIAARLEGLAEPGGICISGVVHEQVKNRLALYYEPMGEQHLKNITDPVAAHRVRLEAPEATEPIGQKYTEAQLLQTQTTQRQSFSSRVRRPWVLAGVMSGILLLIFSSFLLTRQKHPPKEGGLSPVPAIGVMAFQSGPLEPQLEWMRDAVRDHFNSQLIKASGLRVLSKEFIEFARKGAASEMEVAKQLHLAKLISGSFIAIGNRLRIEAHVVDVKTGLIEASDFVDGELGDFFTLHNELAVKVTDRLNVVLAGRTKPVASTPPTRPDLDAYKMLLEAEGETPTAGVTPKEAPEPAPPALPQEEPRSQVPWGDSWFTGGVAWADEQQTPSPTPENEIKQVLEQYRLAYEKKDLTLLESVYDTFPDTQKEANTRYFQNTQRLRVIVRDVDIVVQGDQAAVNYTREDQFVDEQTGQKVNLDARFTKIFVRTETGWRMSLGRK